MCACVAAINLLLSFIIHGQCLNGCNHKGNQQHACLYAPASCPALKHQRLSTGASRLTCVPDITQLLFFPSPCSAKGLVSNIFWFKKPPLLLIPIKFSLFLCSFIISTIIFFAAVFGPNSCPLGNNGFWFAWSAPWWTSIIFTMYIFLHLSFKT